MLAVSRSTPATIGVIALVAALFVAVAVALFRVTVVGGFGLYFVIWWTLLFAILPLRNGAETDAERLVPGQDPGAPAAPRLREKALLTTVVAGVALIVALSGAEHRLRAPVNSQLVVRIAGEGVRRVRVCW